jgi:cobalt/nickel transport system permease protein
MSNSFKKRNNFIERSIMSALCFFKESILSDEYAATRGWLQSLDPRIKAVTFVLFVLLVALSRQITGIAAIYALCLIMARSSGVNLKFFLKRTWIFIPLFSLFIAIPALFSVFTPGEPVFNFNILGLNFIITRPGVSGAVLFVSRVVTSVSLVILLSLTTRHAELLNVLRFFGIPQVFVLTIGMCYRYIYLFAEIVENTFRAIKSRVGFAVQYQKGQGLVSWNIANLWHRSLQMNEQVYSAMLSRGYSGEPKVLHKFKTGLGDWVWLSLAVLICAGVFYINQRVNI